MTSYFAGLCVALDRTAVCVVDGAGKVILDGEADSHPEALAAYLMSQTYGYARIGIEAGPLSQHICIELAKPGLPMVCIAALDTSVRADPYICSADHKAAETVAEKMRTNSFRAIAVDASDQQLFVRRCVPASWEAAYAVLEWFEIDKVRSFSDDEWEEMRARMHQALLEAGLFQIG